MLARSVSRSLPRASNAAFAASRYGVPAATRARSTMSIEDLNGAASYAQPATTDEAPPLNRFSKTLEVCVSKIFPAGFGWQAASVVAGNAGMEADTLSFALTTGAGDFAGVFLGHTAFSAAKMAMGKEEKLDWVTSLWLASAAFCSGSAWQPTVNFLHDAAGCSFATTAVGTGLVTGMCFFGGLRAGRIAYEPLGLEGTTYSNLCGDALLSVSIGAATGTFVGTDVTFADNMLRPFFGIEDGMGDIEGMVRAGSSTFGGFLALQSLQNVTLPRGANWLDPVQLDDQQEATMRAIETEAKLAVSGHVGRLEEIEKKVDAILALQMKGAKAA